MMSFSLNNVEQNNDFFALNHNLGFFSNDLYFFLFEVFFLILIAIFLVFFVFLSNKKTPSGYYLNVSVILTNLLVFSLVILLMLIVGNSSDSYYLFGGLYYNDFGANLFKIVVLSSFSVFVFSLKNYVSSVKLYDFEFIIVLLLSVFSSLLMLNSNDFIGLFFIIELQSLSFYILVSSKQTSSFSTEGGLKYFILGSFSSGIILFGISLIYGFTGFLSYQDLALFLSTFQFLDLNSLHYFCFNGLFAGLVLITVGLLFKLGAAPFHMWMPDVYEGSPMIITAYLATVPKISILFVFFKLYYVVFLEVFAIYQILFILTALLSIILGSVAAIYQIKLKRLLTYSMITNTGYIVLGLSIGDVSGIFVTLFYLISYIFIMLGLFSVFIILRTATGDNILIKRLNQLINLVEINPFLSFSLFLLLFSIAGIPPLLGFYGKLFLFAFTLKSKMYWLTILFVIFSVVSVFYYIRLVKIIYFNRSGGWTFLKEIPFYNAFVIAAITFINCIFFVNPNIVFKLIYNFTFYIYI